MVSHRWSFTNSPCAVTLSLGVFLSQALQKGATSCMGRQGCSSLNSCSHRWERAWIWGEMNKTQFPRVWRGGGWLYINTKTSSPVVQGKVKPYQGWRTKNCCSDVNQTQAEEEGSTSPWESQRQGSLLRTALVSRSMQNSIKTSSLCLAMFRTQKIQ